MATENDKSTTQPTGSTGGSGSTTGGTPSESAGGKTGDVIVVTG